MMIPRRLARVAGSEDGFTMIFAIMILLVASLLVAGVFVSAQGDITLTRNNTSQSKAYYAALAGISRYKYKLNSEPNSWEECPEFSSEVPSPKGKTEETYTVKTLPSSGHTSCVAHKQISIIESSGSANGTFRIESTGESGGVKRSIVATFNHPGFLNFVYLTNYEVQDPILGTTEPKICEKYYPERKAEGHLTVCPPIEFTPTDKIKGPLHTNDASAICAEGSKKPTFGRTSADKIEMNQGNYAYPGCSTDPYEKGEGMTGTYSTTGPTLLPPETDNELLSTAEYKFEGRTSIELKTGTPNTMAITNSLGTVETKPFPKNGVVFVETASKGCGVTYSPFNSNYEGDTGCGDVYVKGSYTESLTIAAANDVIIDGSIETTHESSGNPTGAATLGLIATNFVRIYHPVEEEYEVKHYEPAHENGVGVNKEICATTSERSGTLTSGKNEFTGITPATTGLIAGEEISGAGIATGTKIKEVKSSSIIVLTKNATASGTQKLTFYKPTGFEYRSVQKECVEKPKTGYTYHEAERLDAKSCESGDSYASKGFCAYEDDSEGCDAPDQSGVLTNPVIDAAILSTKHSFIFDNYLCGGSLGELTLWGALAQYWRGIVYSGGRGYIKNYNYDERLAVDQPPNFLSPSTTEWKLQRETAPPNNFAG
jgi:Tfp pilus assembly protein PilX